MGHITAPGHRFNHDILISDKDRESAKAAFPRLFHILDFPELRDAFQVYENRAKAAKKRSNLAGHAAISLGTCALLIVASLQLLSLPPISRLPFEIEPVLVVIAAVLGILSVVAGSQILHGEAKRGWLRDRLLAERLRQLHFQAFARRLPTLVRSLRSPTGRAAFLTQRRTWLREFMLRYEGNETSELALALADEDSEELWLIRDPDPVTAQDDLAPYADLFAAYRALRFDHQIQFASLKLDGTEKTQSEVARAKSFSNFLFLAIAAIFVVDLALLGKVFLDLLSHRQGADPFMTWAHALTLAIAALVLGARALEEGLQPGREVERYLQYRTAMRAARKRFDDAETLSDKLSAIRSAEQNAYAEMCTFLKIHNDAKFKM